MGCHVDQVTSPSVAILLIPIEAMARLLVLQRAEIVCRQLGKSSVDTKSQAGAMHASQATGFVWVIRQAIASGQAD